MVKKVISLLVITCLLTMLLPETTNALDWNTLDIYSIPNPNYSFVGGTEKYLMVEMWHSSGEYWHIDFPIDSSTTKRVRLDDSYAGEYWNDDIWITDYLASQGAKLVIEYELPQNIKDRLASGSLSQNEIQPILTLPDVSNKLRLFNGAVEYKIENGKVIIQAVPRINFSESTLFDFILGMNKKIPIARNTYGCNVYAIYSKITGNKLGLSYADNYEVLPGHAYRDMIKYTMIQNADGDLYPGHNVYVNNDIIYDTADIEIGQNTLRNGGAVGLLFPYNIKLEVYAPLPPTPTPSPTPLINNSNTYDTDPSITAEIKSNKKGNQIFDVTKGIPASESLYCEVNAKEYLHDESINRVEGEKTYNVTVKKTYKRSWYEDEYTTCKNCMGTGQVADPNDPTKTIVCPYCKGNGEFHDREYYSDSVEVEDNMSIARSYSYHTIERLSIYIPDTTSIYNHALPNEKVDISANTVTPEVNYQNYQEHTGEPVIAGAQLQSYSINGDKITITLKDESIYGGSRIPTVDTSPDYSAIADNVIGDVMTRNDSLIFNGTTILDSSWAQGTAPTPQPIPDSNIGPIFYKEGYQIEARKRNGTYESNGTVNYILFEDSINETTREKSFSVKPNNIVIHTPLICYIQVEEESEFNQRAKPDNTRPDIVLGTTFPLKYTNVGEHLDILGYGNKDYSKYIKDREIKLPFGCYFGENESGQYLEPNTWHSLTKLGIENDYQEELTLYIPTWVDEGDYEIYFRTLSISSNEDINPQKNRNLNIDNHEVYTYVPVNVSGRVYDFKVTEVYDPNWTEFFRDNDMKHKETYFYSGSSNVDKNPDPNRENILPIMQGKNIAPYTKCAVKLGYRFSFDLKTVGNYFNSNDFIVIKPKFYYVSYDGKSKEEVNLYYHNDTKYFVQIGSDRDTLKNEMALLTSTSITKKEDVEDTAGVIYYLMNRPNLNRADFIRDYYYDSLRLNEISSFTEITLSAPQRIYKGSTDSLPSDINENRARASIQSWTGTYFLPGTLYATKKSVDLSKVFSITDDSDVFLREGYIVVNFEEILVYDGSDIKNPRLKYRAPLCNGWENEGYQLTQGDFVFNYGDVVLYYTDKSLSEDYGVGGTH